MKRSISLVMAVSAVCITSAAAGQNIWNSSVEGDGFVNNQDMIGVNRWGGWNGLASTAATASNEQAVSGTLSAKIWDKPGSPGGGIDSIVDWRPDTLTSGAYTFKTMQYVPDPHTGTSYFIMLNTFVNNGGAGTNWSCQVQFQAGGDVVADFDGETLPGNYGTWVEIRNVIDLDADEQRFFYDGSILFDDTWTERVSGGGASELDVLDLFNNDAGPVYYDDLTLDVLPQEGACCLNDGSCQGDNVTPTQCANLGGEYQGHGSTCATSYCPNCAQNCGGFQYCTYEIGITLDPPVQICGDTTGASDDCAGSFPSGDDQYELVLEEDGVYTFSLCNQQSFADNQIYLYSDCNCVGLIASDFNSCTGGFSEITVTLTAGTYYVVIEGFGFTEGPYCLDVIQQCILTCPPGAADENEPDCGQPSDTTNGGCNMDPGTELFSPLECTTPSYVVCGTGFTDTATRDTDWYAITVTEELNLTWTVEAEHTIFAGFIQTEEGRFGSADCADGTGYVSPFISRPPCTEASVSQVCTTENDATYYLWVSTSFDDPVECGSLYVATLTCEAGGGPEVVCPDEADDFAVDLGGPVTGNALDLCDDDEVRLQVRQSAQVTPLLPFIRLRYWANTTLAGDTISQLDYHINGHVTAVVSGGQNPNTLRTSIRNYTANNWSLRDQRATPNNADVDIDIVENTNPSDYVNAADGEIQVRQDVFNPGAVAFPLWFLRVDQYEVTVTP